MDNKSTSNSSTVCIACDETTLRRGERRHIYITLPKRTVKYKCSVSDALKIVGRLHSLNRYVKIGDCFAKINEVDLTADGFSLVMTPIERIVTDHLRELDELLTITTHINPEASSDEQGK